MFSRLGIEISDYFNLMKRVAIAYNNAEDAALKHELEQKFIAMYDNATDQGIAYGSCWGNIHHYGYSMRGLFVAYFLMKDVLREVGKLEEAVRTLNWYAITNEVYPEPAVNGIDIDTFNTKLQGRIASILIMEDTPAFLLPLAGQRLSSCAGIDRFFQAGRCLLPSLQQLSCLCSGRSGRCH